MAADAIQAPALAVDAPSPARPLPTSQDSKVESPPPQPAPNYDDTSDDDSDGGEGPHEGYAMLKFGDSCYVMQALQLLIGRDMLAHRAGDFFNSHLEVIQSGNSLIYEAVLPATDAPADTLTPVDPPTDTPDLPVASAEDTQQMMEDYCRERESDAKSTDTCPFLNIHNPKSENDLFNTGSNISRKHCKIFYDADEGSFMVHVLSKNGLFLDGNLETIGQCIELHHGSKIGIGQTEFVFELPNGGEESRIGYGFQNSQGDDIGALYSSSDDDDDSDLSELELVYDQENAQFYSSGEDQSDAPSSEQAESDDEDDQEEARQALPVETAGGKVSGRGRLPKASQKIRLNLSQHATALKEENQKSQKSPKSHKALKGQKSGKKPQAGKQETASKSKAAKTVKKQPDVQEEEETSALVDGHKAEGEEKAEKVEKSSPDPEKAGVTRDSEIINGEGVFIEGLPMGAKIPPKKKGPGRPPKNGFLSKRELNQMSKAHKEAEKNGITDLNAAYLLIESKKIEKASKASREGGTGDGDDGDKDGTDSKKKIPRTARSPSPEMKLTDYTEDQLQRPPDNYVVLIYEALVNHPQKKMNLQQIYSSIERRYPFFKFKTGTSGWQSSVRHNLGQNSTFQKVEKDGKGWMWGVVPGVTLESIREKKKKATPPPMPPPAHHSASSTAYPYGAPHPQSYVHNPTQVTAAGHPSYMNSTQLAQRAPLTPNTNGQHPNGAAGHPVAPTSHGPSSQPTRPNTMYPPPYGQNGQRANPTTNHTHPYGQSSAIRPTQPGFSNNSGPNGLPNPPNRSLSTTPSLPNQRPKPIPRPSPDVIDTFISVFTSSFRDMKYGQEITEQRANIIVRNAVARVLEPDSVAHVPEDPSERAIISAFRKCLEQSQPRQDTAGVPRTYNNYLYPYASRNQSSVFGTPGVSNLAARTTPSPLPTASSTSNAVLPAATSATSTSTAQVARPIAPLAPNMSANSGNVSSAAVANNNASASAVIKQSAPSDTLSKPGQPVTGVVAKPTTIDLTGPSTADVPPRTSTPTTSAANLASSVQQMLADTKTSRDSPRAPAVEPITPPAVAAAGSKRSIEHVEAAESQQASKKPLTA